MTRMAGEFYCNVCSGEIPAGEEANEFETPLLDKKGHCHGECLAQRNAILAQYEAVVATLSALLDPGIESAQKIHQALAIEGHRGRPLKRHPRREPKAAKSQSVFTETSEHWPAAQKPVRKRPSSDMGRGKIVRPRPSHAATLRRKAKKTRKRVKRGA